MAQNFGIPGVGLNDVVMVSDLDANGFRILNLIAPVDPDEPARLQDLNDLSLPKTSVQAATTAALAANTRTGNVLTADGNGAFPSIDGVAASLNNRYLVKNEVTGANNGLFYLSQVGDGSNPWKLTRTTDADASSEMSLGLIVFVEGGTANGGQAFLMTNSSAITLNTTALTFDFLARGTATQTLTNKTLTSPKIGTSILDTGGNELALLTATGSAVNEITLANAATGSGPTILATGDDANIPITVGAKGTGAVLIGQATSAGVDLVADQPLRDSNGNELVKFTATGSAVNEVTIANADTGNGPSIASTGGDTDIDVTLAGKGTGAVNLGQATSAGVDLVADQPIRDSSANELVKFTKTASAVNEVTIANAATAGTVTLLATGGDTDIPIQLGGKGTGHVVVGQATSTDVRLAADQPIADSSGNELVKFAKTASAINEVTVTNADAGNAPSIASTGGDTDIDLTLSGKGTGAVNLGQATSEGVDLVADQPLRDSNGNELIKFTATGSAINEVTITNAAAAGTVTLLATGGDTDIPIQVGGKGTGHILVGQATSTDVRLAADQPIADSSGNEFIAFSKTATAINEITVTNADAGNGPTIAATGDDTDIDLTLSGKGTGAVNLGQATSAGIDLVADQPIRDSSANELLSFSKAASAVNEITIGNAATTVAPSIACTGGDDNIPLAVSSKGTGNITLNSGTVNRLIVNGVAKTIADGGPVGLFEVACTTGQMIGGKIDYLVEASDGTDHQALSGIVTYSAVNKAGTMTLAITEVAANQAKAVSAGTLTLAWTFTDDTNKGTVNVEPTGSLTETTFRITYTITPVIGAVTIL